MFARVKCTACSGHEKLATRSCCGEPGTVQREGVAYRFFSGDGVVKNVPEDKAAIFEVCLAPSITHIDCE